MLDFRATKKFPLGSYSYAGKNIRALFTCEMLVKTSCDTPEDISKITMPDTLPEYWLIVEVSNKASLPTCALFVKNDGEYHERSGNIRTINIEVINRPNYYYKGHRFSTLEGKLQAERGKAGPLGPWPSKSATEFE